MEKAFRLRGNELRDDAAAARGMTEKRYVFGVAAEGRDIAVNPVECRRLIEITEIRAAVRFVLRGDLRMGEQAEEVESVIERNEYNAAAREFGSFKNRLIGIARGKSAAEDPDHDRQFFVFRLCRRPDV